MSMRRPRSGFTRNALLIAAALLATLFVIGVKQLQRNRIIANEQLALHSIRVITEACRVYDAVNGRYPASLGVLGPWFPSSSYLEVTLAEDPATKQGYTFTLIPGATGARFTLLADPVQHGVTGLRHFYVDQAFVIHATSQDQRATSSDPAVP